jgi:hypothetical protein
MIIATGKTFTHRALMQQLGGRWNADAKRYEFASLRKDQIDQLRGLIGVIVTVGVEPERDEIDELIDRLLSARASVSEDGEVDGRYQTVFYGDDQSNFNVTKFKNPRVFFGFSSLSKFVDYVENIPASVQRDNDRNQAWKTNDASFRGTDNMQEAIRLARDGWADGVKNAQEILDAFDIDQPRIRRRKHGVAGGSVNIGRLLTGNPLHMRHKPKQPGKRVITLYVEAGAPAIIETENLITRAIVIAAIVDLMERQGYSCEIIASDVSLWQNKPIFQLAVKLKEAGEKLNLLDLIFALGHPSFLRRFSFAACGSSNECHAIWETMGIAGNAFDGKYKPKKNEYYINNFSDNPRNSNPISILNIIKPPGLPLELKQNNA